jgi:type I restriction enzyme M protein
LFQAHGLDPLDLFIERDAKYFDFKPALEKRQDVKPAIETNVGLTAKETALRNAFEAWWAEHGTRVTTLQGLTSNVSVRNDWLLSFRDALDPVGLLERFEVRGIVAGFWDSNKYDFQTIMARGPLGLISGWRDTILNELEDEDLKKKANPLDHKLVKFLMGDFIEAIGELEAKSTELDGQIKAATAGPSEDAEEGEAEANAVDDENAVDETQIQAWKKELASVKKQLKTKQETFTVHIKTAVDGLTPETAAELLLTILHNDMQAILERYIAGQRKQITTAFENWWDKYRVTLTEIEGKRDEATTKLRGFLSGLGYA